MEKEKDIPNDADSFEVFAIKDCQDSPTGKQAFIGYKINNGNFHFIGVPYTEFINLKSNNMKNQTAINWLIEQLIPKDQHEGIMDIINEAKQMEREQIMNLSNISAKEAYNAGQMTMACGCYEISDATTYEDWLYEKFKSE